MGSGNQILIIVVSYKCFILLGHIFCPGYIFSKDIIIVDRFAFLFFTFRETKLPTFNGYNF